jgi:urease accessory protein
VKARAHARAIHTDAGTRIVELRGESPLVLRETPDALYLVAGAAGPLGGDQLDLAFEVGCGARLRVRSAAATLAQPGPHGHESHTRTRLTVHDHGSLVWEPEPLVSVRGSRHVIETIVHLGEAARLVLVEELVLGRFDEPSGRVTSRLRVGRAGVPLVAHDLELGGDAIGWSSHAVLGDARAVRTELHVGPASRIARTHLDGSTRAAALPLSGDATLVLALAPTLTAARAAAAAVILNG